MRKPRDYDAQLKALNDKAKALKENKLLRLGELVVATRADALDAETLAGGFLAMAATKDKQQLAAWRKAGEELFRKGKRGTSRGTAETGQSTSTSTSTSESLSATPSKN